MNKKIYAVVAAALVVVVGGFSLYSLNNNSSEQTSTQTSTTQTTSKITYSDAGKKVSYNGQEGKTALEILKSLTKVDVGTSSYGEFVTGINGVTADAKTEYWSFYVGGAYANEGAGTYKTKDDEKIEWRLEKLQL